MRRLAYERRAAQPRQGPNRGLRFERIIRARLNVRANYLATEYIAPKWNTVPLSEFGRRKSARGKIQTVRPHAATLVAAIFVTFQGLREYQFCRISPHRLSCLPTTTALLAEYKVEIPSPRPVRTGARHSSARGCCGRLVLVRRLSPWHEGCAVDRSAFNI